MKKKYLHDITIRYLEKLLWKSRLLTNLYISFFENMTLKEFSNVDIKDRANVLVIGCGAIPNTLIILGKKKKWNIVGIDKDTNAVEKARELLTRYKLDDHVRVEEGNGLTIDLNEFDLVVVAHGVEPKERILERIAKDTNIDSIIMYRTTWDSLNFIYGKEKIPKGLVEKNSYYRSDLIKTIMLVKRREG